MTDATVDSAHTPPRTILTRGDVITNTVGQNAAGRETSLQTRLAEHGWQNTAGRETDGGLHLAWGQCLCRSQVTSAIQGTSRWTCQVWIEVGLAR